MTYDLAVPAQLLAALLPDLTLMGGAILLLLAAAWRPESDDHQRLIGRGAMALIVLTLGSVVATALRGATVTDGPIAMDGFRWTMDLVILLGALGTIAVSTEQHARDGIRHPESHVLVLFAASGMMILAAARDLMVIFLGIEIMSVAVYVLAGLNRRSARAAEGALKYFLLGAFATGFLLYGMALIYGATGETRLTEIAAALIRHSLALDPMFLVGMGLLLIGLGFKVAAVPFHMWAPDVYDGAPAPIAGFMAASVKAAAFATFLRIWYETFYSVYGLWANAVAWVAIVTMVVGNVVALSQKNIKRMLAYSSIVHSGYLLVAVTAGTAVASGAVTFYLTAYTLATLGAFAVVGAMQPAGETDAPISAYEGLWTVRPWLAVGMSIYLLAFLGFPVFGGMGFFAKWYLLSAAIASPGRLVLLSVIVVLTSVISAGYYLSILRAMFMKPRAEGAAEIPAAGPMTRTVMVVAAVLIVVLGVLPGQITPLTARSTFAPHPVDPMILSVPAPR
jgi:NADH-quinone oxidoreductase subunit N